MAQQARAVLLARPAILVQQVMLVLAVAAEAVAAEAAAPVTRHAARAARVQLVQQALPHRELTVTAAPAAMEVPNHLLHLLV